MAKTVRCELPAASSCAAGCHWADDWEALTNDWVALASAVGQCERAGGENQSKNVVRQGELKRDVLPTAAEFWQIQLPRWHAAIAHAAAFFSAAGAASAGLCSR